MSNPHSKPTLFFHWLTGLGFIGVLGLGLYLEQMERSPAKGELMGIHKSLGVIILLIAVLRVAWRLKEGPIESSAVLTRVQEILAKSIHGILMLATLLMPISGIAMSVGGGRALEVFGVEILAAGEKIEWLQSLGGGVHGFAPKIIIAALVLHIAAALKHQWVDKDGTLSRMLGRK